MNPFCPECGWRLTVDPVLAHWRCPSCDHVVSALARQRADNPAAKHGERCQACEGTGIQKQAFTEYLPHGDTVPGGPATEIDDCEECDGRGYHLDETGKLCVICGREIPDGTGVLVDGWRVHEDFECSTDCPPQLRGWDL